MDDPRLEDRAFALDTRTGEGFEAARLLGVPSVGRQAEWQERLGAVFSEVESSVQTQATGLSIADLEALRSGAVRQLESILGTGEEYIVIGLEASTRRLGKIKEALASAQIQPNQSEELERDIISGHVPLSVVAELPLGKGKTTWGGLLEHGLERVRRAAEDAEGTLLELRGAVRRVETIERILQSGINVGNVTAPQDSLTACLPQPANPYYRPEDEVVVHSLELGRMGGRGNGLWQGIGPWIMNRFAYHSSPAQYLKYLSSKISKDIDIIMSSKGKCNLSYGDKMVVERFSAKDTPSKPVLTGKTFERIRKDHDAGNYPNPLRK